MSEQNNTRLGILLMIGTCLVFALQDGISRHLAAEYNVFMVVMIRYWFFAAFVMAVAARREGSLRKAAATEQPGLQLFRGALLAAEICVMVTAFVLLGLVESLAHSLAGVSADRRSTFGGRCSVKRSAGGAGLPSGSASSVSW